MKPGFREFPVTGKRQEKCIYRQRNKTVAGCLTCYEGNRVETKNKANGWAQGSSRALVIQREARVGDGLSEEGYRKGWPQSFKGVGRAFCTVRTAHAEVGKCWASQNHALWVEVFPFQTHMLKF